jgi:hypothetical protein
MAQTINEVEKRLRDAADELRANSRLEGLRCAGRNGSLCTAVLDSRATEPTARGGTDAKQQREVRESR